MDQLSGLDAAFVHQDSARTPMHISAVLFYDAGNRRLDAATLQSLVATRLFGEALFQRRLQRVTFDADAPYWIPAGRPQYDYHFREHTLPAGSAWSSLRALLQHLHAEAMDLARPLWQFHLIDRVDDCPGLPPRCQAIVLKAHHAGVDGISLARLMHLLHDGMADAAVPPPARPRQPDPLSVWSRANLNYVGRQIKFADTVTRLVRDLPRIRDAHQPDSGLPAVLESGAVFNAIVTQERSVGLVLLESDALDAIRRAVRGVTRNDVASSIIAGGLRDYLHGRDRLPADSLVAGMPINLRTGKASGRGSNRIATMAVGLATQLTDPVERLRTVHRYALAGKRRIKAYGTGTIMDVSDSVAPSVLAGSLRSLAWASSVAPIPVPFHTMISNVPGPSGDEHLDGLPLVATAGLGPVRDNMGLFHVVSGAAQTVSLSFSACRQLLPDPEAYARCLLTSFRSLYSAAVDAGDRS